MVSDGYNLTLKFWIIGTARIRMKKPISLPMDLTMDIEIRKAADGEGEAA